MVNSYLDFHKIGGFCILRPSLDSSHGSLRWRAAEIIAELTQNNPYCQKRVLEAGLLPVLLSLVDTDDNQQVRIKALYALSCKLFLDTTGFKTHQVKLVAHFHNFCWYVKQPLCVETGVKLSSHLSCIEFVSVKINSLIHICHDFSG
jgi:hypothetical protein